MTRFGWWPMGRITAWHAAAPCLVSALFDGGTAARFSSARLYSRSQTCSVLVLLASSTCFLLVPLHQETRSHFLLPLSLLLRMRNFELRLETRIASHPCYFQWPKPINSMFLSKPHSQWAKHTNKAKKGFLLLLLNKINKTNIFITLFMYKNPW